VVKYKEIRIGVDKDGYLINFDDWNEEVAQVLAEREGFGKLTNQQLDILKFIRDYYKNYNFFQFLMQYVKMSSNQMSAWLNILWILLLRGSLQDFQNQMRH